MINFSDDTKIEDIINTIGDLGIEGNKSSTRIVVAMSGGVDSSVVAAVLKDCGYDVVGITLQLYDHGAAIAKKGACCAGQDIYDAKRVADKINIPHFVLDYESKFKQSVIDDFADTYLSGATPVPCIKCNQEVKFKDLLETAKEFGAKALVTGHYLIRKQQGLNANLYPAYDKTRDQSYFLFTTTQDQANFLRFPLGGLPKSITRRLADYYGLEVADKPDSQDICFVPEGKYVDVIQKIRPNSIKQGDIIHIDGRILGKHKGLIHYTIGQRRGLGISATDPLFVVKLDAEKNCIYVGEEEALNNYEFDISELNWLGCTNQLENGMDIVVKVRSTRPPKSGKIYKTYGNNAKIILSEPEKAVAKGQAAVCYNIETGQLLGGGWIGNVKKNFDLPIKEVNNIEQMV